MGALGACHCALAGPAGPGEPALFGVVTLLFEEELGRWCMKVGGGAEYCGASRPA